ncbi:uncharacterized protein PHALS_09707 [Plasmopara halstedii]|uniref:Uncharacterized protein n=1 Tax=Plasmopara halstedii TaxID=4781 RepID=A0A0P1AG80_PLAHL|nr:uncharacterized protein PHALS_09707 [Plasmopara halstedii]CEG39462.1 hypothetical protein PHALS_09707 [Plasmopara halstedii]|eukprot:XP_024575831.1 hypothetical protein PHALS_09707 [Plasmopara halstedii]
MTLNEFGDDMTQVLALKSYLRSNELLGITFEGSKEAMKPGKGGMRELDWLEDIQVIGEKDNINYLSLLNYWRNTMNRSLEACNKFVYDISDLPGLETLSKQMKVLILKELSQMQLRKDSTIN